VSEFKPAKVVDALDEFADDFTAEGVVVCARLFRRTLI
jgi:hypothetical protein